MLNFKLYVKYILFNLNHFYFNHYFKNKFLTNIFLFSNSFYFFTLHIKLSSLFYSSQLIDIFSYEINFLNTLNLTNKNFNKVIVYNFHNIFNNHRIFVFVLNKKKIFNSSFNFFNFNLFSIAELFPNANWLEREITELHNIFFEGKKDTRNLLLQYGDSSFPMLKSSPSIGEREIFYDSVSDFLIQQNISTQF